MNGGLDGNYPCNFFASSTKCLETKLDTRRVPNVSFVRLDNSLASTDKFINYTDAFSKNVVLNNNSKGSRHDKHSPSVNVAVQTSDSNDYTMDDIGNMLAKWFCEFNDYLQRMLDLCTNASNEKTKSVDSVQNVVGDKFTSSNLQTAKFTNTLDTHRRWYLRKECDFVANSIYVPTVLSAVNSIRPFKLPFVNVTLFSNDVPTIVDTGSAVTLFKKDVIRLLPTNTVVNTTTRFKAANGSHIDVYGEAMLPITIGDKVFKSLVYFADITFNIMGLDFLTEHAIDVLTSRGCIACGDCCYSFDEWPVQFGDCVAVAQEIREHIPTVVSRVPEVPITPKINDNKSRRDIKPILSTIAFDVDVIANRIKLEAEKDLDMLKETYKSVFTGELKLIEQEIVRLHIKLDGEFKSPFIYPIKYGLYAAAQEGINNWLKIGILRRSSSNFQSPLVCVPKKDGSTRLCVDYRELNKHTVPDNYTIPRIDYIKQHLRGRIFSTLDLKDGFLQVPIAEEDIPKTAVKTPWGLYEFVRMPFGLRNAPPTFQRFMDHVLHGIKNIFVYIDDIVVHSQSYDEHIQHLHALLTRLSQHGLVVNVKKSHFFKQTIEYLGYEFTPDGYRPLTSAWPRIEGYPPPRTRKEVQKFLGVVNYYRAHIPNFSRIASPLIELTNKSIRFEWAPRQQEAFEKLKELFQQRITLAPLQSGGEFELYTDASCVAVGAVLFQNKQIVEFYSKRLSPVEQRYSANEREAYALVCAVQHFRNILSGFHFVLWTDHKSLLSWFSRPPTSDRHAKWLVKIQDMQFTVKHVSGEDNVLADLLSRPCGVEKSTFEELHQYLHANVISLDTLTNRIKQAQTPQIAQEFKLKQEEVQVTDGAYFLTKSGNMQLLVPTEFRREILSAVHDFAHYGRRQTWRTIKKHYYWPGMTTEIQNYVKACPVCQENKTAKKVKRVPIKFPATSRFKTVHIDLVGPLRPSGNGNEYIMTMMDRFSRWPEAVPMRRISAKACARKFFDVWVSRYGVPDHVITDQGTQFESELFNEMLSYLGSVRHRTTPYHPQTNGLVERSHGTLKAMLRCLIPRFKCWETSLPTALLAMRTSLTDLGVSPSLLIYGEQIVIPGVLVDKELTYNEEDVLSFVYDLQTDMTVAREALVDLEKVDQPQDIRHFDHRMVWVRKPTVEHSLASKYSGPYEVLEVRYPVITICKEGRPYNVNVDRVKPAEGWPIPEINDDILDQVAPDIDDEWNDMNYVQRAIVAYEVPVQEFVAMYHNQPQVYPVRLDVTDINDDVVGDGAGGSANKMKTPIRPPRHGIPPSAVSQALEEQPVLREVQVRLDRLPDAVEPDGYATANEAFQEVQPKPRRRRRVFAPPPRELIRLRSGRKV